MVSQPKGVGLLTALVFVLSLEDKGRFTSSRQVGAYLGLRPRQDQSGDTDKQLRITKAGDAAESDLRNLGLAHSEDRFQLGRRTALKSPGD